MDIRRFEAPDLAGIIALCAAEGWPSFVENPERARRALTAPGVTTLVAAEAGEVIGFAQIQSDGEIQAHLSLLAVARAHRSRGAARRLLAEGFAVAGGERMDLITDSAEDFYTSLRHFRLAGFRIFPDAPAGAGRR